MAVFSSFDLVGEYTMFDEYTMFLVPSRCALNTNYSRFTGPGEKIPSIWHEVMLLLHELSSAWVSIFPSTLCAPKTSGKIGQFDVFAVGATKLCWPLWLTKNCSSAYHTKRNSSANQHTSYETVNRRSKAFQYFGNLLPGSAGSEIDQLWTKTFGKKQKQSSATKTAISHNIAHPSPPGSISSLEIWHSARVCLLVWAQAVQVAQPWRWTRASASERMLWRPLKLSRGTSLRRTRPPSKRNREPAVAVGRVERMIFVPGRRMTCPRRIAMRASAWMWAPLPSRYEESSTDRLSCGSISCNCSHHVTYPLPLPLPHQRRSEGITACEIRFCTQLYKSNAVEQNYDE